MAVCAYMHWLVLLPQAKMIMFTEETDNLGYAPICGDTKGCNHEAGKKPEPAAQLVTRSFRLASQIGGFPVFSLHFF